MAQSKTEFLRSEGLLNQRPERIKHPLFEANEFFDPLDLTQVRYEMLRTARAEGDTVTGACRLFGFSREYFYRLERGFKERGFVSLLSSPRGRRPLIALNQEVVNFIAHRKLEQPSVSGEELRREIQRVYKVKCSRRTVERIVERLGIGKGGARAP